MSVQHFGNVQSQALLTEFIDNILFFFRGHIFLTTRDNCYRNEIEIISINNSIIMYCPNG